MNKCTTISIDLAKNVYQVALFNANGTLKSNKKMSRTRMLAFVAQHPGARILMEACGSAHHWGRLFESRGYEVRLIPPHIAAKCRNGNKSDANDTLAIYLAASHPQVHFVSVRSNEQQDLATLHRLRQGYMTQRTALANRIRGLAQEYGIWFPTGINPLRKQLLDVLEDGDNALTHAARFAIGDLHQQLLHLDVQIEKATKYLVDLTRQQPICRELTKLPGVAWLGAGALFARLGNGRAFKRGRDAAASLGLVPAHKGTGGNNRLLGITKRGDRYLRTLLVHGARSVVTNIRDKQDKLSCWIRTLLGKHHINKAAVALANKVARIAWAMLTTGQPYQAPVAR